jgi:hypothetical protein
MMHGARVDDKHHLDRERAARAHLDQLGAADLTPRPWQPPPVPPSAVDLIHFFLWWSHRAEPEAQREAALAALELLPAARAELDQLETALLFVARGTGLTWGEMARAMGLNSPQASQQRLERLLSRRNAP